MVVAGLKPGWELSDEAHAPVHEFGGLGRVLSDRRFTDGRYNIFVHCIARVRILRTHALDPFQIVDVEHVEDRVERGPRVTTAMDQVVGRATSLVRQLGPDGAALGKVLGSSDDPTVLSNRLAAVLAEDPLERQRMLEMTSAHLRLEALAERLAHRLLEGEPDAAVAAGWVN
jgi:Lon protease-like protein